MQTGGRETEKKFSSSDDEKKLTTSDPDSNIRQSKDTIYTGMQKSVDKLAVKS